MPRKQRGSPFFGFLKRQAKGERYPGLRSFWTYVERAYDPYSGKGYGKKLLSIEKDIVVLWYLREEKVSIDTMLLASDEVGAPYRRVYK